MNKFLVLMNKFKDCFTEFTLNKVNVFAMMLKLNVIARVFCPKCNTEPAEAQSENLYQKIHTKVFIFIFFQFFLCLSISFAQRVPDKVIDTFLVRTGKIVLYENNKWEYLEEISKDTVKQNADKNYFDSEMLINQGKTPYNKSQDVGKKKKDKKTKKESEKIGGEGSAYSIKKGDTLMAIAKKCGTSVEKLCALNNLTKTSKLSIGQKIKVK